MGEPETRSGAHAIAGTPSPSRYLRPGWFTRRVFNPLIAGLTRAGLSVWGSRELRVRGRTSGEWRATPVNLLTVGTDRYLVAPRGETQWARNLRVAGDGMDEPHLEKARAFILEHGGIEATRVFTRVWLALFGVWPWAATKSCPRHPK